MLKTLIKALVVGVSLLAIISGCEHMEKIPQKASTELPKYGAKFSTGKNLHNPIVRLYMANGKFCTGTVIDVNYILTAAHCVRKDIPFSGDMEVEVRDIEDNFTGIKAYAVAFDPDRDVAFLNGKFDEFDSYKVDFVGDHIHAGMLMRSCGFPAAQKTEYCTNLVLDGNYNFQYKTSGAPLYRGMSGGPVFSTDDGYIIGVNSGVMESKIIISPLVGVLEEVGLK